MIVRPFRWLTMAILALLLAACSGGAPRDTVVIIPPGASIAKAGEILEQAGTTSAAAFVNHARFFGGDAPIKPGEYQVKKRSEEHTSELRSLMRMSYAVFCFKKNTTVQSIQDSR